MNKGMNVETSTRISEVMSIAPQSPSKSQQGTLQTTAVPSSTGDLGVNQTLPVPFTVCLWGSYLTSLSLRFLICKMGIICTSAEVTGD